MRRIVLTGLFLLLAVPGVASAAQLIDRNATGVKIAVNAKGEALFTYRKSDGLHHVLVWGAINAIAPKEGAHQAKFKLDYSGGWGSRGLEISKPAASSESIKSCVNESERSRIRSTPTSSITS